MLEQLIEAINVLNTCKECLDKSVWAIVGFIEDKIPSSDDEDESMNDFTKLALWKVHTEYKNKILLSIQEWEGLYKPVVPPQIEPAPYQ